MEIIKPIYETAVNEAASLKYFLLGSFITWYIIHRLSIYKRPKCYEIKEI